MSEKELTNEDLTKAMKSMNQKADGVKFVDLDDEIDFQCIRCGACCMNRGDIILNPYDVYNIAKAKNIKTIEVIMKYCSVHIGDNSCLPILTLKDDERKMCPFLKFYTSEGKFGCSINDNKPGACMNHPIGVVRMAKKGSFDIEKEKKFMQVEPCPNHKKGCKKKVREFISGYLDNEENHDAGATLLSRILKYVDIEKLVKTLIRPEEDYIAKLSDEEKEFINFKDSMSNIFEILPTVYISKYFESTFETDTTRPFIDQVNEIDLNIQKAAVKLIGTVGLLHLDIMSPDIKEEQMSPEAAEEMRKFIEITNEMFKEMEQEEENE